MANELDEEVDEQFDDFEDDFEGDLDEDLDLEDFDEEEEFEAKKDEDDILETQFADAVRANPKRMSAAQRRKTASIIEGIISDAELSSPEGQSKAWGKLKEKTDTSHAKPYNIKAELTENDVVDHPRFGVGFVIQLLTPTKVEVLFDSGIKRLVCNQG